VCSIACMCRCIFLPASLLLHLSACLSLPTSLVVCACISVVPCVYAAYPFWSTICVLCSRPSVSCALDHLCLVLHTKCVLWDIPSVSCGTYHLYKHPCLVLYKHFALVLHKHLARAARQSAAPHPQKHMVKLRVDRDRDRHGVAYR